MRLVGQLFLLFVVCAGVAWLVWTFALDRSDVQRDLFTRATEARYREASVRPVEANAFRATACGQADCVLVEAGGLSFVLGGGAGTAAALHGLGLLRADLDGVLLTSLAPEDTAGLAELAVALQAAGRATPLVIYGAQGIVETAASADGLLQASVVGAMDIDGPETEPSPMVVAGGVVADPVVDAPVFDSGVVQIWRRGAGAGQSTFRIDHDGRSLVLAGCGADEAAVRETARGVVRAHGVIAAGSGWMLEAERAAAEAAGVRRPWAGLSDPTRCLTVEQAITATREAGLASVLLAPLRPAARNGAAERAWREGIDAPSDLPVIEGLPGARIDATPAP